MALGIILNKTLNLVDGSTDVLFLGLWLLLFCNSNEVKTVKVFYV